MLRTSRLFFALWPDDGTRLKLAQLGQSIQMKRFKPVPPHNFHVTLVFIGNVNEASKLLITQRAADISAEPFVITLDYLSYWDKPKVLCLTSRQPVQQALALAQALDEAITSSGIQTDSKPYNPHVTLARHVSAFIEHDCGPVVWKAESFCLVESCNGVDGVFYKVKEQWPFVKTKPL